MAAVEFVRSIVTSWEACTSVELLESLERLSTFLEEQVDAGKREEMALTGMALRHTGACEYLVSIISRSDTALQAQALLLLGNMVSDELDPKANITRERIRPLGVIKLLLPHLMSNEMSQQAYDMKLFSLGLVMNLCADGKDCTLDPGGSTRPLLLPCLEELATHGEADIQFYAKHCLHSIEQGTARREELCARVIQAATIGWRERRAARYAKE